MNFESKVMKIIHKIREEHYKNTKKKKSHEIEESLKKETRDIILKLGLKYSDFEKLK